MSPIVTILLTSLASIISVIIGGALVHSRTKAETKKLAAETEELQQATADRVYNRIKEELAVAVQRADKADDRAVMAEKRGDMLAARIYELYDMIDQHITWDRMVAQVLLENNIHVPAPPKLNLASLLNDPKFGK